MGFLIITDSEYTTWPGALQRQWSGPGEHREIVQIGAVKTDEQFNTVSEFMVYVRPTFNPVLSEFFCELTNINQATVDSQGLQFRSAYQAFKYFCGVSPVICMNGDSGVWRENCRLNQLEFPFNKDFYRLGPYAKACGVDLSRYSSGDLHKLTSIPLDDDQTHDALHDSRSMSRWLRERKLQGYSIDLTEMPTAVPLLDPRAFS